MKRAALVIALCACSLRNPRVGTLPCSSTAQCDRPAVCFLGECRGHSSALTLVAVEIRPANDSPLGVSQVPGLDLRQTVVHDFALVPPLVDAGTLMQAPDVGTVAAPVPGALITFTDHAPGIPDRVEQITARTDNSGAFSVRLPQGKWDVLVQPSAPLPPYRPPTLSTDAPSLSFTLPRVGSLTPFQAALLLSDGGPLAGAAVTAVDANGAPLSATATALADGGFSLYLPPGTSSYAVEVGPPSDLDGGTASSGFDPLPNYDNLAPTAPAIIVTLPPTATLAGKVSDAMGAPVAAAHVYARSDGMPWSLSRSTTTAADGTYALLLRAGNYVVEAAPAATADGSGPAVSGEQLVSVVAATSLLLTCPNKVFGFGVIVRPGSVNAVSANYQITATRLPDRLLTARTAHSTPTDSQGIWHIIADPGRYRLEVVPTADSGLPRKVVQIELLPSTGPAEILLPQIMLSPPLTAFGRVHGAPPGGSDAPVANATVSFYALDANGHGILLGSSATDSMGQYKAILPDVAQPGAVASGGSEPAP
jgi:hypothetical protein